MQPCQPVRKVFLSFLILTILFSTVPASVLAEENQRPSLAPQPGVSLNVPSTILIGDDFSFSVTFDNTSTTDTDVGYGPFVDIFLPQSGWDDGTDGEKEDGVAYTSVDYLGNSITTFTSTCQENGTFSHPLTNLIVTCPSAPSGAVTPFTWQYLVVEIPFGSFAPDQPTATVDITAALSDFADLNQDLPIYAQGGYRFGADALDNPTTDPPIIGSRTSSNLTPSLFILNKEYLWREDETPTGPNYPRQYEITVNIPDGQTVTDLVLSDILPNNMQFIQIDSTSPAATSCALPSTTIPGGTLSCTFESVTGTDNDTDASITFSFYIPLDDNAFARVISPTAGGCVLSENEISAQADWDPLDPRDDLTTVTESLDPAHQLEDCSHTIQKFLTILTDAPPSGFSPGDVVDYRLEFQISDFFAEDDFTLTDTISDGHWFDDTFTPTFGIEANGYTLAEEDINATNFSVDRDYVPNVPATPTPSGNTTVTFRLSEELVTRGQADGFLIGGCVPLAGTGASDPDCATYNDGPTTGVVHFRAVIQETFSHNFPSGDQSVDQGDRLTNSVIAAGTILNNSDLTSTGNIATENSSTSFIIEYGSLEKTIYAVNGSTTFDTPVVISPSETITYRIVYSMNTSDVEDLQVFDFLPLPVLDADELTVFDDVISGTPPPAGHVQFGPTDTFKNYSGIVPTIAVDSANNSVDFLYGNFDSTQNLSRVIDLLLTVTVSDDPFADGLFLTNQTRVYEGSTNHLENDATSIILFELAEPNLSITKGAVASNRTEAVFTPAGTAPTAFTAPGGACPRFTPPIQSANLDTNPIISDVSNLDSGDLVTFVVTVENSGQSDAFDVHIKDDLPAGFAVPAGGINLCVTNGAGSALLYTDIGSGFLDQGIELTDVAGGALKAGQTEANEIILTGENIAIISFDLELTNFVVPEQVITNTATLSNYTGAEGGGDFTAEDKTDDVNTSVLSPDAEKILDSSEYGHTTGNTLTIGEPGTFHIILTIPEGSTPNAIVTDNLPNGLAFVDCESITPSSSDLSTNLSGGFSTACNDPTNPTVQEDGGLIQFSLGDISNINKNNAVSETITIAFRAVVLNTSGNQQGTSLSNTATFTWDTGTITTDPATVVVVEPLLDVDKSASSTTGDAGDLITFTITITNPPSGIEAFDVFLYDEVPAEITYQAGSFQFVPGGLPPTVIDDTTDLTAQWTSFPAGSSSTLQFSGTIKTSVTPGDVIYNDAITTFTSLPLAPGEQSSYNDLSYERTGNTLDPGGSANDYVVNDPAQVTIEIPTPIKYLITTSEGHTNSTDVAIGEIVRYRISTIIPEGTSIGFQVQDILPEGLLFLNDNTARFAYVSNGGGIGSTTAPCDNDNGSGGDPAAVASALVDCIFPAGAITNAGNDPVSNPFADGNDPWFDFGDLTNTDSDTDDREFIIVEFNALVLNTANNQAGTSLVNDFHVIEGGDQVANAQNLTVTIVEPDISINKVVSAGPYDAGDTLTYTITLSNTGANATMAFDMLVYDVFDVNLQVQSYTIDAPVLSTVTDNSSGNTIDVTLDQFNVGDTLTITVTATIPTNVPAFLDIANQAEVQYTSLTGDNGTIANSTGSSNTGTPGTAQGERTGEDGAGELNDFADTDPADITLSQPIIDKRDPSPTAYTIGEQVTYPIKVTLPEGITQSLVIIDDIPTGMEYVSHSLITSAAASSGILGEDFSGSILNPTPAAPGGSGGDLTLTFGDVTTSVDTGDPAPDNNSFLLYVTARVMNIPANNGGDTRDNIASLSFTNPNDSSTETITDDPITITIIEPNMEITKAFTPDQAAINESVQVTLVVTNSGTSPAYDVIIEDPFPTATFSAVSEGTTPSDFTYSTETTGGNLIVRFSGGPIEVDGERIFIFNGTVGSTFPSGATFENTATVTQATTIDGDNSYERDLPDVDAQDTLTGISPDLVVSKDDDPVTTATPDGILVYTITIDNVGLHLAEGITVTDVIPAETTFNAANSDPSWSCTDITAGSTCTYNINSLASGAQRVVAFALQVVNPILSSTDQITNTATAVDNGIYGDDPTPFNNSDDDTDSISGAAPLLSAEKTDTFLVDADSSGNPSPGDTLRYTITITNSGNQGAGNVIFDDSPDGNTTLIAGTVTTTQGSVTTGNTAGDTAVQIDVGEIAGAGGSVTIHFNVLINDPLPANTTYIENQGILSGSNFTDEPTDDPDLPGDDDPTLTMLESAFIKAVVETNQDHTSGQDAAIGEMATYQVTLYVPPGDTLLSTLNDTLNEGLAFVDCVSITPANADLTTDASGGFGAVCANPTVSASPNDSLDAVDQGRSIDFNLGNLNNASSAAIPLVIRYQAVVLNNIDNENGSQVRNFVTWEYDSGSLTTTALPLDIVEPDLQIRKSADSTNATNNDVITFTLRISHTGASSADAFEVVMSDILPANLAYVPNSFTQLSGPTAVLDDTGAPSLSAEWDVIALGSADAVLQFEAVVTGLLAGQSTQNTANLSWTSLPNSVTSPQSAYNTLSTERFYDPPSDVNLYGDSDSVIISAPSPTAVPTIAPTATPRPTPTFPATK